jgi:hypothetical protein
LAGKLTLIEKLILTDKVYSSCQDAPADENEDVSCSGMAEPRFAISLIA